MPRGCTSCRRWKKKCIGGPGQPCSSCKARGISCEGRFVFKNQSWPPRRNSHLLSQEVVRHSIEATAPRLPKLPVRNNNEILAITLMHFLGSTHVGYNLKQFRLSIFGELPKRIGSSVALDASIAAFLSILQTQQSSLEQLSPRSRRLYFSGLKALQRSFEIEKGNPNTLCAAYILWECSVWVTHHADISRGYGEGIVNLISNTVCQDFSSPFLRGVCSGITTNLLQDSVFNPNVQLGTWMKELYDIPGNPLGSSIEVQALSQQPACELGVFAMVPELMRSPSEKTPSEKIARIKWAPGYILDRYAQVKVFIARNEGTPHWNNYEGFICNERQGSFIAIGVTLNALLRVFYPSDMLLVIQQSIFCKDAIDLAERAKQERPFGAHHVPQAIVSAYCVTNDDRLRRELRGLIEDYRDTFAMAKLIRHISSWPDAPEKLREIPWFTLCYAKQNTDANGTGMRTKRTKGRLQEYCCIL